MEVFVELKGLAQLTLFKRQAFGVLIAVILIAVTMAGYLDKSRHSLVHPFLIYYGWIPKNPEHLAQLRGKMSGYSIIVLGSGDERQSSGDLMPTRRLVSSMPHTIFYGYVDIGVTGNQPDHQLGYVERALVAWHHIGARGVLLDCAGPDYGVSPMRLQKIVALAHRGHLKVLVNSWNPSAVLEAGLRAGDAWLAENWVIAAGKPINAAVQGENVAALPELRRHHIAIWMTATDSTVPSAAWVTRWAPKTASLLAGSYLAVSGSQYSSRSNTVIPVSWLTKALSQRHHGL
ncbi:MAG: hypothetical protein M1596_05065 [Firmicutes bacterium]|nr:hypothetical protein [Bacillota bacterium]